jgi:hypothetical protein
MKTVFKYPLTITDLQLFNLPAGATFLHAGPDPYGDICLWAAVDTNEPIEPVKIRVVGTGNAMPDSEQLEFIGTVLDRMYVWHVFKVL